MSTFLSTSTFKRTLVKTSVNALKLTRVALTITKALTTKHEEHFCYIEYQSKLLCR
jgi:hypothetical protein